MELEHYVTLAIVTTVVVATLYALAFHAGLVPALSVLFPAIAL